MCFLFLTCIENAEEAFSCHCSTAEEVQSHYVILYKTRKLQ